MQIWRLLTPFALSGACAPLSDLDATGRSATDAAASPEGGTTSSGASAGRSVGAGQHSGSSSTGSPHGGASGKTYPEAGNTTAGGVGLPTSGGSSQAGFGMGGAEWSEGGVAADADAGAGTADGPLPDLPNDQANSPVQGDVTFVEASYSGDASFEVSTPTAHYVVLRDHGVIVSITDVLSGQRAQWIGYSNYRPRRRVGIVSNGRLPDVTTTLDEDSVTARHVRLRSESATGDWLWTWDFYATQATLTIARASDTFGFTYRGTPGGQLDDADRLVLASGESQSAENSLSEALPGTAAWLYLADPALGHSLFLIQHARDELLDRYDSLDGDSAAFMFGDEELSAVSTRFSLGLVNSTNHASVSQRAEFVIAAVQ